MAHHSLGGKIAAQFVYENPNLSEGLCIIEGSHQRDFDISERSIPTLKIFAENVGLASMTGVEQNKHLLLNN